MRTDAKPNAYSGATDIAIVAIAVITVLINQAWALPAGPHHGFLTGPWELVVQIGMEGQSLHFPVTVSDENKPEKLNGVLPVMGTPIKIRLERYLPDLRWETTAVQHTASGIVAKLTITGENLKQDIWLSPDDPARQSISSSIGGVAIKKLHDPNTAEKLLRELVHPKAVGIVSVWPPDSNSPLDCVAKLGETLAVPKSKYKLTFLDYVPHYSIDTKTKKVVSRSDKPINPAIKVSLDDGQNSYERWLWAKFPSSPHGEMKLPLRMEFSDFDLGSTDGRYILVAARASELWLLFSKKEKTRAEKAILGRPYPFANEEYSFSIEKVFDHAVIKTDWKNNSESLLHPAIIASIEEGSTAQQVVLEFNKSFHYKTKFGTVVLIYRRQPGSLRAAN